jgi:hypothetical protein
MRFSMTAAILALATLFAGCRTEHGAASTGTTVPPPAREVRLLNPGKSPRSPLRYRFQAGGSKQAVELRASPTGSSKEESIALAADVSVRKAADGGSAEIVYASTSPTPGLPAGPWVLTVSNRGVVEAVHVTGHLSAEADGALRDALSLLSPILLPDEPVGVGASWMIHEKGRAERAFGGIRLKMDTVIEVEKLDESGMRFEIKVEAALGDSAQIGASGTIRFDLPVAVQGLLTLPGPSAVLHAFPPQDRSDVGPVGAGVSSKQKQLIDDFLRETK